MMESIARYGLGSMMMELRIKNKFIDLLLFTSGSFSNVFKRTHG